MLLAILAAIALPPLQNTEMLRKTTPLSRSISFMADAAPSNLKGPNEKIWAHRATINQLPYPACVGAAWTNWLNAQPQPRSDLKEGFALSLWRWSVNHDQYPSGEEEGTDPYVAQKRLHQLGKIEKQDGWGIQYEKDLRPIVLNSGPVCIAIPWYDSFDRPEKGTKGMGRLTLSGQVRGGHFILIYGINQKEKCYYALQTWVGYQPYDIYHQEVQIPFEIVRRLFNRGGYGINPVK